MRKPQTPEHRAAILAGAAAARERKRLAKLSGLPPEDAPEPIEYVEPPADKLAEIEEMDADTEALIADGILTREEVLQLRLDAATKVMAERKAAAKKSVLAKLVEKERAEGGLLSVDQAARKWAEELVDVQIRLPSLKPAPGQGMGRITPDPIRLDNRIYVHGRNYRVSREVAQTLYDQMGKAVKHHAQIAGESPAYYNASQGVYMWQGGVATGSHGRTN
jgi:hypothetical protein